MIWVNAQTLGSLVRFCRGSHHDFHGDFLNMIYNILNVWLSVR